MAPFTFFCGFVAGTAFGIILHELGHWLAAVLAGIPIRRVRMGWGPLLLGGCVGETGVELRAVLWGGMAYPYMILESRVLAEVVFVLGGVLGNSAILAALSLLPRSKAMPVWVVDCVAGVAWAQLWMIFTSLFPQRFKSGHPSDGLLLLTLARTRRSVFAGAANIASYRQHIERYVTSGEPLPPTSRRSARIAWNLTIYRRDGSPDRDEALGGLLRDLARGGLEPAEELLILDALVTDHVMAGDGPLRDKLNALSLRACELAPGQATLRGSRGAALVEIGRLEEGRALLTPLADGPPSFDTILSTLFLARACLRLGGDDEARRHLARARAMLCFFSHPESARLLARVEAEFAARSGTDVGDAERAGSAPADAASRDF